MGVLLSLEASGSITLGTDGLTSADFPILTRDQGSDMTVGHLDNQLNALSALFITVDPHGRNMGLAERLIEAMKQTARAGRLRALVVPL